MLVACGDGNNDQPLSTTYGYNQNLGAGNLCPPQTAQDWNTLVASRCNTPQGSLGAQACVQGAYAFEQRNRAFVRGNGCTLAVSQTAWCPGNSWQSQQFYQVNESVLQGIYGQYGWGGGVGGPGSWPGRRYPR
jgi:hypothetical protein